MYSSSAYDSVTIRIFASDKRRVISGFCKIRYLYDPIPIRQTPPTGIHTDRHYRNPFGNPPGMVYQLRFGPILDSVQSNRMTAASSQQSYNLNETTQYNERNATIMSHHCMNGS